MMKNIGTLTKGVFQAVILFSFVWISNGFAQWQPVGLQGVGLVALVSNGTDIFAGGNYGGGIYHSIDSGVSWIQTNTGLTNKDIVAIGNNGSIALAATDTSGIFLSTNNGSNWISSGWKKKDSVRAIVFLNSEIFLAVNNIGVFRSTDGGMNWESSSNGLTSFKLRGLISLGNDLFINSADAGVFRSSDHGNTWINESQGLPNIGLDAFASDSTTLYGANTLGLYRSTNFGRNWLNVNPTDTTFAYSYNSTYHYKIYSVVASDSGVIVGTGGGIYRTLDNGLHWIRPKGANADVGVNGNQVSFLLNLGKTVVAGLYGGISRSTDHGVSWPQQTSDVHPFGPGEEHQVNCIAQIGNNLFAGIDNGFPHSIDGGVNWIPSKGLSKNKVNTFASLGANFFVGTDTSGIFLSTDSGMNWTELESMSNSYPITALVTIGSSVFASTLGGGIFRSSDIGKSWLLINNGITTKNFYSLFVNGNFLYAGGERGVLRSNNMGQSWDTSITYIGKVYAITALGNYLFAGEYYSDRSGDVFRSSDNGITWTSTTEYGPVLALAVHNGNIFVGNGTGIHTPTNGLERTMDTGASWISANYGLTGSAHSFAVIGDTLYAGTVMGVWRRPLSDFPTTFGIIKADNNLDLGQIKYGDTLCKYVVIRNIGTKAFTLLGTYQKYGDTLQFRIDTSKLPAVINPGDSLELPVCFESDTIAYYNMSTYWRTDISPEFATSRLSTIYTSFGAQTVALSRVNPSYITNDLSLSPNPTTGILSIRNAPENITSISIVNVLGEKMLELSATHSTEFTIDISKLAAGIYDAIFYSANAIESRKIIKQ
jgi:photosystem II stability/assembly factor-like uncharacterized protein